ncbi:hypothetical protein F5B19DRAFT_466268, partial [Rostrohypoxylon terebratum]
MDNGQRATGKCGLLAALVAVSRPFFSAWIICYYGIFGAFPRDAAYAWTEVVWYFAMGLNPINMRITGYGLRITDYGCL